MGARRAAWLAAIVGLLCVPAMALAQTTAGTSPPPHVPLQKSIGQTSGPHVYQTLIVMNARGATLQGDKLVLSGVAPNSILFADRPVRAAGHALTAHVLQEWSPANEDKDSFAKDPPNATVSAFSRDGSIIRDSVVVLKNPKLDGDRLTFDVQVLEGDLAGADGPASIFIDIIGRPWTPLSFAGAARRTAVRGAWYRGAAAAAAYHPYGYPPYDPYHRPPCGYYPYPPCY